MTALAWEFRSALPGVKWPAIPGPEAAQQLALQFQLEGAQWLNPEQLRERQFGQLVVLLRHAFESVPYYRERWRGHYDPGEPLTPERFARLPLLKRRDLQLHFEALRSTRMPAGHGAAMEGRTSGSTGQPVRFLQTGFQQLLWKAVVLREHQWFERDLGGRLAAIRQGVPQAEADGWGPATDAIVRTGRSATLPIDFDVDAQLKWLERQQPEYLLTYPSNLAALARRSLAQGIRLARLREARTLGEVLPRETRELCREAWDVPVTDNYSAQEVGYLALQCPEHEHYHVQSECVWVELLDARGEPCAPGAAGRVVVTPLHALAMPLVRYDIGDYATVGPACGCGRGLPVLSQLVGRARNMLVLEDGSQFWPAFGSASLATLAPILQQQLVQKRFNTIEVRLVTARPLTADDEERMRRHIQARLPAPFEIAFSYHDLIPRSSGGKFEDFVSEVAAPR